MFCFYGLPCHPAGEEHEIECAEQYADAFEEARKEGVGMEESTKRAERVASQAVGGALRLAR